MGQHEMLAKVVKKRSTTNENNQKKKHTQMRME